MIIPESYLAHGLFGRGEERANHKYVARIPTGKNSYRYFYSNAEYKAYKMGKSVGNRIDKMKDQTSKTIQAYNNKVRAAANKTSSQVSKFANRAEKNINKSVNDATNKISDVLKGARKSNHPETNKHEEPSEYMKLVNRMNKISPEAKSIATAGHKAHELLSDPGKLARAIRNDPEGVAKLMNDVDKAAGTYDNVWSTASDHNMTGKNIEAVTGLSLDEMRNASARAGSRNAATAKGRKSTPVYTDAAYSLDDIANNEASYNATHRDHVNFLKKEHIMGLQSDIEYYRGVAEMFGNNRNKWPENTRKDYEQWLKENREAIRKYGIDVL